MQVLISTLNSRFFARKYEPPFADYLVINQGDKTQAKSQNHIFNQAEQGLSKSRNFALQKASSDICLITDDDIVFLDDAEATILCAFAENPDADIITFTAKTPDNKAFKAYPSRKKTHTKRSIMRVSSWEIAFRREAISRSGIRFDERFGLGSKFQTGEENIFLFDALNYGLKIIFLPLPIVIHPKFSSGGDFDNPDLVRAKGAMLHRMFPTFSRFAIILFTLKKAGLSRFSMPKFYKLMRQGAAKFHYG